MKKFMYSVLLLLFCVVSLNAQRQNFMYPDISSDVFYDSVKYVNPKFYPGIVITSNGKQSGGSINLCTVDQKLHFISNEKDTVIIKDNESVERVYILGRAFVNSKYGYLEMIETAGNVTLCELKLTEIHTDAAPGAYGLRTQTSAAKQLTSYETGHNPMLHFDIDQNKSFSYRKKPFLLIDGEAYPVNRKTLAKFFPEQKSIIEQYMEDKNPVLTSVAPVQELFCMLNRK